MAEQSIFKACLAGVAIIGGLYLARDGAAGKPAPAFSLPMDSGHFDLASYRGRPVLLVFWSTSCGICRRELPLLNRLAPEFRGKGIAVIAIHLGSGDDAREYMNANHIDITSLVDPEGSVASAYHVSGIPKLVLIGNDGTVKRTSAGMAGEDTLRRWMSVE